MTTAINIVEFDDDAWKHFFENVEFIATNVHQRHQFLFRKSFLYYHQDIQQFQELVRIHDPVFIEIQQKEHNFFDIVCSLQPIQLQIIQDFFDIVSQILVVFDQCQS